MDDVAEGELTLPERDRVSDVFVDVGLRDDAGEPAAPDDREFWEALPDGACHLRAVGDLVAEDARAREEECAVAGLHDSLHIVLVDHRIDDLDLVALLIWDACDLEELQREQVRAHADSLRWVCPVWQEEDQALFMLNHEG